MDTIPPSAPAFTFNEERVQIFHASAEHMSGPTWLFQNELVPGWERTVDPVTTFLKAGIRQFNVLVWNSALKGLPMDNLIACIAPVFAIALYLGGYLTVNDFQLAVYSREGQCEILLLPPITLEGYIVQLSVRSDQQWVEISGSRAA